ncbi:MAG: DUF362 domain-containing protein [Candidatus Thorarchaeota archaeon]
MADDSDFQCPQKKSVKGYKLAALGFVAILSAFWFVLRTGTRPSRILYPCQQAALSNISFFKITVGASLPSFASLRVSTGLMRPVLILTILSVGGFIIASDPTQIGIEPLQVDNNLARIPLTLTPHNATTTGSTSDIFYVQNATGPEGNMDASVNALIELMTTQGLHFYDSTSTPDGMIGEGDVIIIKMNGQWPMRGGTNTDLIKSVINAIHAHPDGFTGEVVIADNGQGDGNLNRRSPNSYYQNESAQEVAESFTPEWNVSTILWDNLRTSTVDDYDDGDFIDGYVRSSTWNNETNLYVSYPKFKSPASGVYISFKKGVWWNETGFNSNQLKIINMPVFKTHDLLAVTGCVKNYMGVPQGYVVESVNPGFLHEHFSVANGGMGTMIAETRAPILNILDMVWVNAHPVESSIHRGPWSRYSSASATDIIGASIDPVALDYWSAKNVLIPTAQYMNYSVYSSIDPDYEPISEHVRYPYVQLEESFHTYLRLSMNQLKDAGFQVTMNPSEMNVFVVAMDAAGPVTPTFPDSPGLMPLLAYVAIPIVAGLLILAAVVLRRRTG